LSSGGVVGGRKAIIVNVCVTHTTNKKHQKEKKKKEKKKNAKEAEKETSKNWNFLPEC